jgi:hypothetical protein
MEEGGIMPFSRLQYDAEDLALMQAAFDAASAELGIGPTEKTQRERLAEIICDITKSKIWLNVSDIKRHAVEVYRNRAY